MTDRLVTVGGRPTYDVLDEDTMVSDSEVGIPTQQSVKAYVDAQKKYITAKITDISTGGSTFVVCPIAGTISKIYSTIHNAITVADAGLSFELDGTPITDGGITVEYDGSAAGDVDSATPTAANVVTAGQAIEIITDGASTTACECTITFEVTPS